MPIYGRSDSSSKTKFPPCPEGGYAVICGDVWDPWSVESTYPDSKGKIIDKTRVVFLTDEVNPDTGQPYEVSEVLNLTMGSAEKPSRARERFTAWRGKAFSDQEARAFDWETLIGKPAYITVIHNTGKDGRVWANIASIAPLPKGMKAPSIPASFTRKKDRDRVPAKASSNGGGWDDRPSTLDDVDTSEVPF
jgi:hypothetical protein